MIGIVDYGLGNVQAFLNAYYRLGIDAQRISTQSNLSKVSHLILPGVGHFDAAMSRFNASGLCNSIHNKVFEENIPILGVCVGMQMLTEGSDEGEMFGLGWMRGRFKSFQTIPTTQSLPSPHMGWNTLQSEKPTDPILHKLYDNPSFYFLHGYYYEPGPNVDVLSYSTYGHTFPSLTRFKNIYGIQCHPEKSHHWGEQLLLNFSSVKL